MDYYAEVIDTTSGEEERVPGERATNRIWSFTPNTTHSTTKPSRYDKVADTVVAGRWGSGPGEFGLVLGNESSTDGPAAFDFEPGGDLVVLDQINKRILTYKGTAQAPNVVAVKHSGALGDLVVDDANLRYVLDDASDKRTIQVVRPNGVVLTTHHLGLDAMPAKLEAVGDQVAILDGVEGAWKPVFSEAAPQDLTMEADGALELSPAAAEDIDVGVDAAVNPKVRVGERDTGPQMVSWADESSAKFALVVGDQVVWGLEVRSDRFMGEIQLAEIVDGDLWGVVRTWDESGEPAFEAFRFDGSKVVERLAIQPAEYALSATLGQFEAGPDGLYQMRSTARDFSIVRYEFGG